MEIYVTDVLTPILNWNRLVLNPQDGGSYAFHIIQKKYSNRNRCARPQYAYGG